MITFKKFLDEKVNNKDYLDFEGSTKKRALKKEMTREIERFKKKHHRDPSAYPDDWTADKKYRDEIKAKGKKMKTSAYTDKYKQMYGESADSEIELVEDVSVALKNKAENSGIPIRFLRRVYNKGLAAWRTGHRPGVKQHQWAMARVNSFIVGGPAREADKEIWAAYQESKK